MLTIQHLKYTQSLVIDHSILLGLLDASMDIATILYRKTVQPA